MLYCKCYQLQRYVFKICIQDMYYIFIGLYISELRVHGSLNLIMFSYVEDKRLS